MEAVRFGWVALGVILLAAPAAALEQDNFFAVSSACRVDPQPGPAFTVPQACSVALGGTIRFEPLACEALCGVHVVLDASGFGNSPAPGSATMTVTLADSEDGAVVHCADSRSDLACSATTARDHAEGVACRTMTARIALAEETRGATLTSAAQASWRVTSNSEGIAVDDGAC